MKLLFYIALFVSFFGDLPDLAKVRADYMVAAGNKEVTVRLFELLSEIKKSDEKVFVAYKGASLTMMAKYAKDRKDKKAFFKDGAGLIEFAVSEDPKNIEIRIVRLSIQENAPKFLKYNTKLSEDKEFILNNYEHVDSKSVKAYVKSFVMQSDTFSAAEKERFN
jgi:hypothetical protein